MDIVLEKSLINSHCYGMDSIVVKDAPGMVRMFIARPEHTLWRNYPDGKNVFSVAMHKHHCDITLMPVLGDVYHVLMGARGVSAVEMRPYRYTSPILGDHGKFDAIDNSVVPISLVIEKLNSPTHLPADVFHSIYVPKGQAAAWWIWEQAEDPDYVPTVWSNDALEYFDFKPYNQPMTEERLKETLALIGVNR